MRVREIMKTKVQTVAPSEPVVAAVNRFRTNRIHHLVVTRGATVMGLVTRHDVERVADDTPVADVMSSDVVAIGPDATVREAANKMRGRTIGCLPVIEEKKLVGIITTSDLLDLIGRGAMIPIRNRTRRGVKNNRGARRA